MKQFFNSLMIKLMSSGGGFSDSKIALGTQNLATDILNWLFLIIPIFGGACIVYFCIRRAGADEQDKKQFTNRIVTAIISTVVGLIANSIISLVVGYFQ